MLVGQTITLNLQMAPSTLQETVTVTGEAPLIETQSSELGGNIDPRQVRSCRRWDATGCRWRCSRRGTGPTRQGALPVQDRGDVREFQLNVDGLQVTANLGTGNQARYSNDAIAEFQFISNRFDATQGRSSGVQVNADHQVGHQQLDGTFVGNFRDASGTRRIRCSTGCCRTRTSSTAGRSAVRSSSTSCTTSATTSTSTSR